MVTDRRPAPVLGRRALGGATLARQHLLRRTGAAPLEVVEDLVGMQAQSPTAPYFGLWSRVEGFRPEHLSRLLLERRAVRIVLMRGTVHLVSAADCLVLRPLVQPIMDRDLRTNAAHASALAGADLGALADAARALVDESPRTAAEVGRLLAERWPERPAAALGHAARDLLPLVQIPPRGIWGRAGQPVCATAEAWLGRPLAASPSIDDVVLRYLAAFGPATVADAQTWSGLPRLREVVERLRPRLRTFRDEAGRELFDVPDGPRPDPDTPAPPAFLAPFDNLLLSHADRDRVIGAEARRRVHTQNGLVRGTILLDGAVGGFWDLARARRAATLTVTPFAPLRPPEADALAAEGGRLLDAFAADAGTREVRFAAAA